MGILAKTIFALFHIVANFNNFHHRKASVCQTHLPNWYLLLCFHRENMTQYLFEPKIKAMKKIQGDVNPPKTSFFVVFRDFNDFHFRKAPVCETHLPS